MRFLFFIILAGVLYFTLPRLPRPFGGPNDYMIKEDFYYLMITSSSGPARMVKKPAGWVEAQLDANNMTGNYRVRIADFDIIRKPPEISTGNYGVKGQKIYPVEISKTIEREYQARGDVYLIRTQFPKTESSRVRCIYYRTKEGKWEHTPPAKI